MLAQRVARTCAPVVKNSVSVYVHWPYCAKICPYCNFNRVLMPSTVDHPRLASALVKELNWFLDNLNVADTDCLSGHTSSSGKRTVVSVYFGGGTPSLASPEVFESVITALHRRPDLHIADDIEVTMEVNPTSAETKALQDFKAVGVNRLSVGVQALNDNDLVFLGRNHSKDMAIYTVHEALKLFDRVSFDLMYARRANQKVEYWRSELREALEAMPTGHVSLYTLTLEPGTAFHKRSTAGQLLLPSDDEVAEFYEVCLDETARAGLSHYEVSNFAAQGHESVHNLQYWMSGDYIGIGPGACGRWTLQYPSSRGKRKSSQTLKSISEWLTQIDNSHHGVEILEDVSQMDQVKEVMMMGLRTKYGVSHEVFAYHSGGRTFEDVFGLATLSQLRELGLLQSSLPRAMVASKSGMLVLNSLLHELFEGMSAIDS